MGERSRLAVTYDTSQRELLARIERDVRDHLAAKPRRLEHTLSVADTAERLALHYGVDPFCARAAGLLHDWEKASSPASQVERARELVRFLRGIHVYVNLIPCNSVEGRYAKPEAEDVLRFKSVLQTAGFECEIRAEQGADIDAACGQLRRKENGMDAPLEHGSFSAPRNIMAEERAAARAAKPAAKPKRREFAGKGEERGKFGRSDENADKRARYGDRPRDERAARGAVEEKKRGFAGNGEERGGFRGRDENGGQRGRFRGGEERDGRRYTGARDDRERRFSAEGGERGTFKRRRENAEPQERYRSGKMKEARPTYRGGGEERSRETGEARSERNFRERPVKGAPRPKSAPAPKDGPFAKFYKNSAKTKRSAKKS